MVSSGGNLTIGDSLTEGITIDGNENLLAEEALILVDRGGTLNIGSDAVIRNAIGEAGGAILTNGTLNISDGVIEGNRASNDGGAIVVAEGIANITGGIIQNNEVNTFLTDAPLVR
jgi:hypothetical protein